MAEFRYKAYISYSHKDEARAAWLHRALESYRVPRNLVGSRTSAGEVPQRIRPVFRDRDDLSSATDLKGTVNQALADAENLIVVCSPDAAASHWVSEEIRQFARLGRADRIFCIIVGGDLAADGSVSACFPPVLAEIGLREPLASDLRKWADGRHVAKLKLIAGLLGIRLDELRQRDLQRRRKQRAAIVLGSVAALALAAMTVRLQISERLERDNAEQLATFIVDLGEDLKSNVDLETLAGISAASFKYLQGLNPDRLSPETGKKVALALRQMGQVSRLQGRPDEALKAFQRSRNLLFRLREKHPEIPGLLFELGNAEYYIGALHDEQGRYEDAIESMQNYHHLASKLLDSDPENPDWIMELAYSHNNLAAVQMNGGVGFDEETQAHVAEAVRLFEMAIELRPESAAVAENYATILAWAADAQRFSCNLESAMTLRVRVRELAEAAARADPGNNNLKLQQAYAVSGVARVQIATGQLDVAAQNLERVIAFLQQLSADDLSNVVYRTEALLRQFMLARLQGESGQLEEARSMLEILELELRPGAADTDASLAGDYIDLLIVYADIESRLGAPEVASKYLQAALRLQTDHSDPQKWDDFDRQRVQRARYQWWEQNGEEGLDQFNVQTEPRQESAGEFRSCDEADMAARMFIVEGDRDGAAREVAYLRSRGYADPAFMRYCRKHDLCE